MRLETTTIYIRTAAPPDETSTPSPLDRLFHQPAPTPAKAKSSVGRLKLHFKPLPDEAGRRSAQVTIEVCTDQRPIYFTGTQALEIRPGFVSLQIPPLEHWAESLRWLTFAQQARFEEPEFYEMLQRQIAKRLPGLPPSPPG